MEYWKGYITKYLLPFTTSNHLSWVSSWWCEQCSHRWPDSAPGSCLASEPSQHRSGLQQRGRDTDTISVPHREEETQIPSGCLTERKKHRYHQGALIPQFICRVLVCCRVKNAGVGRARYLHLMTWQRWLCNTLETLPVTCRFSNGYKYSIWLVQQSPPAGYLVSSLFWDSHCPHTVCLWQDTEKATLGRFWTSRIRLSSKT